MLILRSYPHQDIDCAAMAGLEIDNCAAGNANGLRHVLLPQVQEEPVCSNPLAGSGIKLD